MEIIVEYTPDTLERVNIDPGHIFSEFINCGFCIHSLHHDGEIVPLSA